MTALDHLPGSAHLHLEQGRVQRHLRHRCLLASHSQRQGEGLWESRAKGAAAFHGALSLLPQAPVSSPFVPPQLSMGAKRRAGGKQGIGRPLLRLSLYGLPPLTSPVPISIISLCIQHGSPSTGNAGSQKECGPWHLTGLGPRPQLRHLLSWEGPPKLPNDAQSHLPAYRGAHEN